MQFKDLLEVLESDEQLLITVTNEFGDEVFNGTVEHFREDELFSNLRVRADRVYTRIIEDDKHSDVDANRVALTTQIEVTLYDDEHKIIFPDDEEDEEDL